MTAKRFQGSSLRVNVVPVVTERSRTPASASVSADCLPCCAHPFLQPPCAVPTMQDNVLQILKELFGVGVDVMYDRVVVHRLPVR